MEYIKLIMPYIKSLCWDWARIRIGIISLEERIKEIEAGHSRIFDKANEVHLKARHQEFELSSLELRIKNLED